MSWADLDSQTKSAKAVAERFARKTEEERETERLVRPSPKLKPPRRDKRRERIQETDPDTDTRDKDLSHNYKDIGGSLRLAVEWPTDEARKKYLEGHPKADPAKHTVKEESEESAAEEKPKKRKKVKEEPAKIEAPKEEYEEVSSKDIEEIGSSALEQSFPEQAEAPAPEEEKPAPAEAKEAPAEAKPEAKPKKEKPKKEEAKEEAPEAKEARRKAEKEVKSWVVDKKHQQPAFQKYLKGLPNAEFDEDDEDARVYLEDPESGKYTSFERLSAEGQKGLIDGYKEEAKKQVESWTTTGKHRRKGFQQFLDAIPTSDTDPQTGESLVFDPKTKARLPFEKLDSVTQKNLLDAYTEQAQAESQEKQAPKKLKRLAESLGAIKSPDVQNVIGSMMDPNGKAAQTVAQLEEAGYDLEEISASKAFPALKGQLPPGIETLAQFKEAVAAKSSWDSTPMQKRFDIPDPVRSTPTKAQQAEALNKIVDAFPPKVAARILMTDPHPDDVQTLIDTYQAARNAPIDSLDELVRMSSDIYQTDPEKITPPKVGVRQDGEEVPWEALSPEERGHAYKTHQMQVLAMSMAAEHQVQTSLRKNLPKELGPLAADLADVLLKKKPVDTSEAFQKAFTRGHVSIEDDKIAATLKSLGSSPEAQKLAVAAFQANDYQEARQRFGSQAVRAALGEDTDEDEDSSRFERISENDSPHTIVGGLVDMQRFFDKRSSRYPKEHLEQDPGKMFKDQVLKRIQEVAPDKYPKVRQILAPGEAKEYDKKQETWEKEHSRWSKDSGLPEPKKPVKPDFYDLVSKAKGGETKRESFWQSLSRRMGFGKAAAKVAARHEKSFYLNGFSTPMLRDKSAVYHGVEPLPVSPYPGWGQAHQRDLGDSDWDLILTAAKDWLKQPVLSVPNIGATKDAQLRAALDLAIQTSPYQAQIQPPAYNMLLARLAGKDDPTFSGLTQRVAARKMAGYSFAEEYMNLLFVGNDPFNVDTIRDLQDSFFKFRDDEGNVHDDGHISLGDHPKYSGPLTHQQEKMGLVRETVVWVKFPDGAGAEAFRAAQNVGKKHHLTVEKVPGGYKPTTRQGPAPRGTRQKKFPFRSAEDSQGEIVTMRASHEIRKFAAQAAETNPTLAYDLVELANKVAAQEKQENDDDDDDKKSNQQEKKQNQQQQKKEASDKFNQLRALVIRTAASNPAVRPALVPVLQAIKEMS